MIFYSLNKIYTTTEGRALRICTKRIEIFLKEVQIDLCVDLLNFQRACEVENLTFYLILSTNKCPFMKSYEVTFHYLLSMN